MEKFITGSAAGATETAPVALPFHDVAMYANETKVNRLSGLHKGRS